MAEAQLFNIVARIADRDLAGMMEPVTISDAPRADAFHFEVNDIIAKERDYALERANPTEALGGLACRAPAQGFGPGESADDGRNECRNHFGRRAARTFTYGDEQYGAVEIGRGSVRYIDWGF